MTPEDYDEVGWGEKSLLELSDSIRACLRHDGSGGPDIPRLSSFLVAAVQDEAQWGQPTLDLATIEHARLDKLLAELVHFGESLRAKNPHFRPVPAQELPLQLRIDVSNAKRLRRLWRRRFRERYFMMDQHRCAILVEGGRLKDVSFDNSLAYDLGKWLTKVGDPISELEGNLQFDPGQ